MVEVPKIRKVRIRNFRSISDAEFDVEDLCVIVGGNDAGKSNVFRALNLFFNNETGFGEEYDFERDYNRYAPVVSNKAKEIRITVTFELPDSYHRNSGQRLAWTKKWRANGLQDGDEFFGWDLKDFKRKSGKRWVKRSEAPGDKTKSRSLLRAVRFEYIPAVRSALFHRKLRGRIYDAIAASEEGNFRETSTEFEDQIGRALSEITDRLSERLNDDTKLRLPNDLTQLFESLDFLSGDASISLDDRGDGIKARYIPFILEFITNQMYEADNRQTFIWAYEEPENNLEFSRSGELAKDLIEVVENDVQILLTTHSPVFYNVRNEADVDCNVLYIEKGQAGNTIVSETAHASRGLDERMGVMTFIAPYMAEAAQELSEARANILELKAELEGDEARRPRIYCEGASDHRLFRSLSERFFPAKAAQVQFVEPPARAGAEHVANSLIAHEFYFKNLPKRDRINAVGIFDFDEAGKEANQKILERCDKKLLSVSTQFLTKPPVVQLLSNAGADIPVELETLYGEQAWADSVANGLSVERNMSRLKISYSNQAALAALEEHNPHAQLILKRTACSDRKVEWVESLLRLEPDLLRTETSLILSELETAFTTLGIT